MTELLHLYTGDGKGKTTASMGLALRALGHGWTVLIAQFLKDGCSGELAALAKLPGAVILTGDATEGFVTMKNAAERAVVFAQEKKRVHRIEEAVLRLKPRLIVLDELAVAIHLDCVDREEAEALIACCLQSGETVVTGRSAPDWLCKRADYFTECVAHHHPYANGVAAREGIEY